MSPLQLGMAHESRPLVHSESFLVGNGVSELLIGQAGQQADPPIAKINRSSLRTLYVSTGMCSPQNIFPVAHAPKDTAGFRGSSLPLSR